MKIHIYAISKTVNNQNCILFIESLNSFISKQKCNTVCNHRRILHYHHQRVKKTRESYFS